MSFLKDAKNAIKDKWTKMNGAEKLKIAVRVLCGFGSGAICGVAARKYIESEQPGVIETTAVMTVSFGAALALSDCAYNSWNKVVDAYQDLKKDYKELKDEYEEEVVG